ADGGNHVGRFGYADDRILADMHCDLGLVQTLFRDEHDMRFEITAEDFGEFGQAALDLLANCGSDDKLPSSVLNVHYFLPTYTFWLTQNSWGTVVICPRTSLAFRALLNVLAAGAAPVVSIAFGDT